MIKYKSNLMNMIIIYCIILLAIICVATKLYFIKPKSPVSAKDSFAETLYDSFSSSEITPKTKTILITDKFWKNDLDIILEDYVIDINDTHNMFLTTINKCKKKLNIIIDTTGGDIKPNDMMIKSILKYAKSHTVNTYIPYRAYSAGSMLALVGKQIHMGKCALLSPTDPQIEHGCDKIIDCFSSNDIMKAHEMVHNATFAEHLRFNDAKKYHFENINNTRTVLESNGYDNNTILSVQNEMCSGKYTHSKPFDSIDLKKMGLKIVENIPSHIGDIMNNLYNYKKLF